MPTSNKEIAEKYLLFIAPKSLLFTTPKNWIKVYNPTGLNKNGEDDETQNEWVRIRENFKICFRR